MFINPLVRVYIPIIWIPYYINKKPLGIFVSSAFFQIPFPESKAGKEFHDMFFGVKDVDLRVSHEDLKYPSVENSEYLC